MTPSDATCWTLIYAAAEGDRLARERFARLYQPIASAYLASRWQRSPLINKLDDAVQDVFVECFKADGVLNKAVVLQPGGFRAFFHGVLRNIARRHEEKHHPAMPIPDAVPTKETSLSRAFDKAWARSLLKEAARVQIELARIKGERATKRVELLQLRFQEGLPIRDIAEKWNQDPDFLHHEYATARDEFREALQRVMAFQMPNSSAETVANACKEILYFLN